jgi:cell shape-determining protein MreD
MNWLTTFLILIATFLAVFWEAAFQVVRHVLGAQIDLLPSLMVYAALAGNLSSVCLVAGCGGLWFDSLSANPLGISILPLFAVGFVIHLWRDLILGDEVFAQTVLGLAAGAVVPILQLLLLLTAGKAPQLGWGTVWQLIVMSLGAGLAAPVFFFVFEWFQKTLFAAPVLETSFRADREIRRGR